MEKPKYYNKHIEEQNKKLPMMEYFLDGKQLKDCSKECQEQIKSIKKDKKLMNVRCKVCKSENWQKCWAGFPLEIFCLDCKQTTLGEGNKLY